MAIYDFELNTEAPLYNLTLSRVGAQGVSGIDGTDGSNGTAAFRWLDYATSFSSDPTLLTVLAGNEVYTYKYNADALTTFRHITTTSDEFYSGFDGAVFTGLLATKQQTITA